MRITKIQSTKQLGTYKDYQKWRPKNKRRSPLKMDHWKRWQDCGVIALLATVLPCLLRCSGHRQSNLWVHCPAVYESWAHSTESKRCFWWMHPAMIMQDIISMLFLKSTLFTNMWLCEKQNRTLFRNTVGKWIQWSTFSTIVSSEVLGSRQVIGDFDLDFWRIKQTFWGYILYLPYK